MGEAFAIDFISPVHLARLRKSWNMDHRCQLQSTCSNEPRVQLPSELIKAGTPCIEAWSESGYSRSEGQQITPEGNTAKYLGIVVQHLAQWAGFETNAAINELRAKLPIDMFNELQQFLKHDKVAINSTQMQTSPA